MTQLTLFAFNVTSITGGKKTVLAPTADEAVEIRCRALGVSRSYFVAVEPAKGRVW